MTSSARIGYARVSSEDQNLERQLKQFDSLKLDKVFTDKVSGKNTDRLGYSNMMDYVRDGDELFICSMDRLARNLNDLLQTTETLQAKGVAVHFLKENISLSPKGETSPISKLLLSMMGAVAEFERSLIRERQKEGILIAKEKGTYKGRKPLDLEKIDKIKELSALGVSVSKIARDLKLSRTTVYYYLKK